MGQGGLPAEPQLKISVDGGQSGVPLVVIAPMNPCHQLWEGRVETAEEGQLVAFIERILHVHLETAEVLLLTPITQALVDRVDGSVQAPTDAYPGLVIREKNFREP